MRSRLKLSGLALLAGGAGAALTLGCRLSVVLRSRRLVAFSIEDLRDLGFDTGTDGQASIGAVLGAGLRADGSPTAVLARRVEAGASLYRQGALSHLVMSGDDNHGGDQPEAMARLARTLGVDREALTLDRTGVDTAATCRFLARRYPGRRTVLVTQAFHANRTAYLARKAGLDAVVFTSPVHQVRTKAILKATAREVPASVKATFVDRFS